MKKENTYAEEYFGKKTVSILQNSPYGFKIARNKNQKTTFDFNGHTLSLEIDYVPGPYSKRKMYFVHHKKELVLSATSLNTIFSQLEAIKKLF